MRTPMADDLEHAFLGFFVGLGDGGVAGGESVAPGEFAVVGGVDGGEFFHADVASKQRGWRCGAVEAEVGVDEFLVDKVLHVEMGLEEVVGTDPDAFDAVG